MKSVHGGVHLRDAINPLVSYMLSNIRTCFSDCLCNNMNTKITTTELLKLKAARLLAPAIYEWHVASSQ
jgi:hypothetical protein